MRSLLAIALCALAATATTGQSPRLTVGGGAPLRVLLGNKTVIREDALTLAKFSEASVQTFTNVPGWDRLTIMKGGSKKDCIYCREVGFRPDRIEITWYIKFAPYQFGTEFPGHTYNLGGGRYAMKIPTDLLDGAHYKAVTGSLLRPKIKEGRLSKGIDEGKAIEGPVWYITFTRNGQSITFDLNPVGPHNFGRKTMLCEKDWRLSREGDAFVLWANMRRVKWGDMREFKVVITPHEWAYEKTHATNKRGYTPYIFPSMLIDFGKEATSRHVKGDCSLYNRGRGHGWRDASGLDLVATGFSGPLKKDHVRGGEQKKTYLIDARNGLYLINLVFGSADEASGPFNVFAGGQLKLTNLRTAKGAFSAKTIHTRAENGQITLAFQGKSWMLNGLSAIPLIADDEDYLFKRTWWIQQSRFNDWFAGVEAFPPMPPIVPKTSDADPMAWAWNGSLETLEASLDSNRAALDTPESVEQRLRLIKSAGFKGVIIGGLHFRYGQKDSVKKNIMLRNTRLATATAHKLGLKVIDHWDFNWVFYTGYPSLLKALDRDPDCLQRHAHPLTICMSFCLNSPVFMEEFKRLLIEEQKATNVDGYMLDEVNWIRPPYCLCDRCRRIFREETGYALPHETSGFLENFDNPLWRAFVAWRGQKIREVFAGLRAEVRKVRPDAVFLRYTSSALSWPKSVGLELNRGMPWGVDYVGDEFHPDDIMMNWRTMFVRLKNRQGVVASYRNAPTWILPRNLKNETRVLYAWALARMNRANVWYRAGDREFSRKLHTWPGQMQDRYARPVSEVAVLLSQSTRDFKKEPSYYHEAYSAWLQTMAEESVQYNVILDGDLTPDKLEPYKVLLLANVALLGEKQAAVIRGFAASGRGVIATYEAGLFDEQGDRREDSVLANAMNLEKLGYVPWKTRIHFGSDLAKGMKTPHMDTTVRQCAYRLRDKARSRVLAEAFDPVKERRLVPAIIETPLGKGKFYYVSGDLLTQNYEQRMASPSNSTFLARAKKPVYPVRMNRDLNVFAKNLLTMAIGEDYRALAVGVPEKVIYTVFEQAYGGKSAVLIHFLNCRGKPDLSLGDPLRLIDPIPQPPLPTDVALKIKSGVPIANAFIVAPLKEGEASVRLKDEGDCTYSVTVPREAIENYAILYLEKAESGSTQRAMGEIKPLPAATAPATRSKLDSKMMGEPYEPDEHTLLLMHFDETEGAVAHDAVDASLKGTMSSLRPGRAVWTQGRFDGAMTFAPDGQQMVIPNRKEQRFAFTATQDFTIDFWLHTDPPSAMHRQSIIFTGASSSKSRGLGIYVFNGKIVAQLSDGERRKDSRLYVMGDHDITGDWHHVALVVDRSGVLGRCGTAYLFIDGTQQKNPRDISKHGSFQSRGDMRLGSYTGTANYGFDGKIDELRISNKVRLPKELGYGGYFPRR